MPCVGKLHPVEGRFLSRLSLKGVLMRYVENIFIGLVLLGGVVAVFVLGVIKGSDLVTVRAVEARAAEWVCNPKTGVSEIQWLTGTNRVRCRQAEK